MNDKITVLSADDPNAIKLGWTITEYIGPEIYYLPKDSADELVPVSIKEDLKEGSTFCTCGLSGLISFEVYKDEYGFPYGECGNTMLCLQFDCDDRHCWTCVGFVNKRALAKMQITS